jgi:hypothetical protein
MAIKSFVSKDNEGNKNLKTKVRQAAFFKQHTPNVAGGLLPMGRDQSN